MIIDKIIVSVRNSNVSPRWSVTCDCHSAVGGFYRAQATYYGWTSILHLIEAHPEAEVRVRKLKERLRNRRAHQA